MTTTLVTSVILIDQRIRGYETIVASVRDDVKYIVYDVEDKLYPTIIDYIKAKITALNLTSFTTIGIVEYNENKDYYHLFGQSTPPALINSVIHSDPNLDTWSLVKEFISYLKTTYSVQYYDMIACSLYSSENWKYIIDTLSITSEVQIRASTNKTGSVLYGGDWILESSEIDVNMNTIYFTDNIEHFEDVLDVTATITNTIPTPFAPSYGSENGEFLSPRSCRIYNNQIYVADDQNKRIQIFDLSLNYITKFENRASGTLYNITDFVINPVNGRIYTINASSTGRLIAFDASFNHLFTSSAISYPRSLAIDLSGILYVSKGYEILKYNSSCQLIGTYINNNGSGDGQLSNASGMIFDSSNNLWLSDEGPWNSTSNHRVQKFDINGNFLLTFGSGGSADTSFNIPYYLTLDSQGNIYVPDGRNDRVKKFTNTGTYLMSFGGSASPSDNDRYQAGMLDYPIGVAVDSNDNVYVVELNNHRLQKFNSLDVSQASRSLLTTATGSAQGYFNLPWDVAVYEPNENVYVVDQGNHRIQKFNASLYFVWSVGSLGSGDSSFNEPRRIVIDTNENIYVTDRNNHKVRVFNSSGVYQRSIGSGFGNGNGQLNNPSGIAVDTSFNVYVSDNNSRIQLFNSSGTYVHSYNIGQVVLDMALDLNRNIYITSSSNNANVYKFSSETSGSISPILTLSNQGSYITGISVDLSTNNFITLQTGAAPRFKMYNSAGSLIFSSTSNLVVNGGQGLYLYNNSNTLYYTDTYGYGVRKVALSGFDITPTYQSISQVTKTFGVDASFSLTDVMSGISNSSGAYTFTTSSAAITISGEVATINAYTPSAITVTANQAATTGYYAGSTTFTVLVNRGTPTYQVISQVTKTFGTDVSFSLTAVMSGVSNSSGAYTFSSSSAAVSVDGNVATINAYTPSAITITASQDISGNYLAGSTTFTVLVNRKTPTYGSFSVPAATYGDASFSIAAYAPTTDSTTVPFTYTSSDPTVATISLDGTIVTVIGQGYTTITASQEASGNYAAGSTTTSFLVNRAAPTFLRSFTIPNKTFGVDTSFSLLALTDGLDNTDGAYSFTSSNAEVVSISGDGITATILGYTTTTPVTIYVAIDACGNYAAATTSGTVSISRGTPTYQSISQVTKTFGDAAFSLTDIMSGVSNSGGAYTFTSSDASAVNIGGVNGDTATILAYTPSAVTITASQAASGNYSSSSTTFSVIVNRKSPTIGTLSLGQLNGYYDISDEFFTLSAPTTDSSASFLYSSTNTSVAVVSNASFTTRNLLARYDPSSQANMTISSGNVTQLTNLYGSSNYNLNILSSPFTLTTVDSLTMLNGASGAGFTRNLPLSSNLTIIIVIRYNPGYNGVSDYATIFQHGSQLSDISIIKKPGSNHQFSFTSNYDTTNNLQLTNNTSYILVGRVSGNTREFWAHSQSGSSSYFTASGVSISPNASTGLYIGSSSSSSRSYFGEMLYYNDAISDEAISVNLTYLRNKWFNISYSTKYVRFIGNGDTTITASQDICGNYAAGSSSSLLRIGATVPTFGSFTVSATTKKYGDAPFILVPPTSNSDGAFTFTSNDTTIISIVGNTATIIGAGTVTISVTQDPSGSFTRKTVSQAFTVNKISPNLRNFTAITRSYASGSFNFTPPESDNTSGNYQYTVTAGSNVISISNSAVPTYEIITGGTATVSAYQYGGNSNYATETITTTITITPVAPTNSYSNFSRAFHLGTFAIPAPTTNSSLTNVTYTSSDTSVVTITDSSATILKVGTSVITASIPANTSFLQSDISAVLTITKGTPTMTGHGLVNTTISMTSSPFIPYATSTSNGTFTYVSDNSGVVLITNNNTINPVSVGTANITATIGEDTSGNYNSRSLTYTLTVVRSNSNLSSATFTVPNAITYGDAPANLIVAPTSNNTQVPIVYSSANTSIATIDPSSGVITAQGSGTVFLIASQAQTSVYNSNTVNSNFMIVNRKTVTQTKNEPYTGNTITKYYGDASFQLSTTSESTGSVLFNTNVVGIASITTASRTATVSLVGVGTVTITAIQLANSRYSTQNDAVWQLTVEKGTTVLTGLAATLTKNVTDVPFYVSATSASTGTKSYALANPANSSVLTVNSSTGLVTLMGAGSATVVISQAASALYNAPTPVSCVITVTEAGTSLQGATLSSDRVFTNVDMTGASLANTTINNVSFSGATLTNAVMSNATMRNAVMTSATLTGASFASSDISGTNFTSASLSSVNMANTVLTNSVMTNSTLSGATMTNATITRSTFTGATARNVNFTGTTLTDSTLTNTDLSGSILRQVNVAGSNFVGAVLANTDLSGAVVTNANFTNANISGADITNVSFSPLQKLQLLKNTNNRAIGGIQVLDVSGSVILSAISDTSAAATIPNIANAVVKVVIPTTSTNVGETIPNVTLDTTTSDKFYFPINTDEYFQIEGVKYYVSNGVIKRQSDNETVSVVSYENRRIWLIAGSVIASVLQQNTISSSTFTVASYKLDTDAPFAITVQPTSNSNAPIVYSSNNPSVATIHSSSGVITIHKQGYVNFIATQAETELYEGGSKMSNELFVNKLINFTLTGLNQAILMNTLATLDASAVSLESTDAVAVYYVKQSDIKNVFKFQSDSNDMNEDAATDVKYYVFDRNWPAELKINPLHGMMNKPESVNMLGNAANFDENKMLVKHDFIRYLSLRLFNTIHGVDLLKNEMDLLENSVYGGETNRNNIHGLLGNVSTTSSDETMSYDASGNKYLTNDASGNTNLCRELLRQMVAGAPSRFGAITNANSPQSLPFEPDDTINFKITLQAAPLQNLITGVSEIPSRSYMIKLIIKSNVTGSNANTAVVDSEMYPNSYPYSSSVVSYQPTSASSSVYNSYSPPAPIPFTRFGFNGWYYINNSAWVNVAPAIRNHIKWIVPSNNISSTVGGLSYVRVNLKIYNKTTLPYIVVYTQSGSYRKYGVPGGGSSLTNGTKYTFYMNFNSYTREPAVIGYTNISLTNTTGVGSFGNNEVISSIALETDSNATTNSIEFTLSGIIVGDIVSGVVQEKEYGFLADVPAAYP